MAQGVAGARPVYIPLVAAAGAPITNAELVRLEESAAESSWMIRVYRVVQRVYFPATIIELLAWVTMTAVLESGRNLGQAIAFSVVAIVFNVFILVWLALMTFMLYTGHLESYRRTHLVEELEAEHGGGGGDAREPVHVDHAIGMTPHELLGAQRRMVFESLAPYLDTYFGMLLAFGFGTMAFWVIDFTPGQQYYWNTVDGQLTTSSYWLAAVDFFASATAIGITRSPDFPPLHVLSRTYCTLYDIAFYLFLIVCIAVATISAWERIADERKVLRRMRRARLARERTAAVVPESAPAVQPARLQVVTAGGAPPIFVDQRVVLEALRSRHGAGSAQQLPS
jgi:hypothetical protein